MPRKVELAMDRERIMREADPIRFLADVMKGKPVEELDWEGEVIGYARPNMDHRVVAARELLNRVVPTLKSVDVNSAGDSRVRFVFNSPIPLPHSRPGMIEAPKEIEADLDQITVELEDDD